MPKRFPMLSEAKLKGGSMYINIEPLFIPGDLWRQGGFVHLLGKYLVINVICAPLQQ